MVRDSANPYESPEVSNSARGHARFRLRRWFALTLLAMLLLDFASQFWYGYHPYLMSLPVFMMILAASVFTRHEAEFRISDDGIQYRDLIQFVDVAWDRVVRVAHQKGKTSIETDSALAQITIVSSHEDFKSIAGRIEELQAEFHYQVVDYRRE
ncbi:MAG: hypothetical protein AAF483_05875 [Planctomycetota bacterium]